MKTLRVVGRTVPAVLMALTLPAGSAAGEEGGPQKPEPPAASPSPSPPPPGVIAGLPIKLSASVTVRYDNTSTEDQTDLLLGDDTIDGFRGRFRFGAAYADPKAAVGGGIRLSAGQFPNPASPFVRLGDAFRPLSFGLDQYHLSLRPFKDRDRAGLTLGKMPQPFWRGDKGIVRSEAIWDDDVSPVGGLLNIKLYKGGGEKGLARIENNLGYFYIEEITEARFEGLSGKTTLVADQLIVQLGRLKAAASVYVYDNLNNGLRSPNFTPGQGASVATGRNAFLLRPGLQSTNNRVSYGADADGFIQDQFVVFEGLAQYSHPVGWDSLGKPEVFVLGQYLRNSEVDLDGSGWGLTVGFAGGAWNDTRAHPFNLHVSYRDIDADATLATFADSDLGAGTAFKGFEIAGNYKLTRNLGLTVFYFDFAGWPRKDNSVERLFIDLVWDF